MNSDSGTVSNSVNSTYTVSNGKIVAANWKEHLSKYGYTTLGTMTNGAKLQKIYNSFIITLDKIAANTMDYISDKFVCKVNGLTVTEDIANIIYWAIKTDNPQYYWIDNYVSYTSSMIVFNLHSDYLLASTRKQCDAKITSFVKSCTSNISSSATDYDKALYVHDYIANHTTYLTNTNGESSSSLSAHSILGICSGENAVCEGYALTYEIILNAIGVDTVFIAGTVSSGGHGWNANKISGKWYYTDLTWDDLNVKNYVCQYSYFNMNEKVFAQQHTAFKGFNTSLCNMLKIATDNDQTYYTHNGGYITASAFNNWCNNTSSTAIRNSISKALSNIRSNNLQLYFEVAENKVNSVISQLYNLIVNVANSKTSTSNIHPTDFRYTSCGSYSSFIYNAKILKPMSKCSIKLSSTKYTYSGAAKKPTVTIKYGTMKLTANTDYTVSYSNNVNAGTAKVIIKGKGSNYKGTVNKTFTIAKASMSKCTIGIYNNGKYYTNSAKRTYTGSAIKPSLKVVFNNKYKLVKGTSYTVKYSSNKSIGKAKVVITGKGNFSGTKTSYFSIIPKKVTGLSLSSKLNKNGFYTVTFKWRKVSHATGYQIFYRTSTTAKYKKITIKNASTLKKTVSGIKGYKIYYNVRAYTKVGKSYYYSSWV